MANKIIKQLSIIASFLATIIILTLLFGYSVTNNEYKCEIAAKNIFIENQLDTLTKQEAFEYALYNVSNTTIRWYLFRMIEVGKAPETIEFWEVNDYIEQYNNEN